MLADLYNEFAIVVSKHGDNRDDNINTVRCRDRYGERTRVTISTIIFSFVFSERSEHGLCSNYQEMAT